MLSKYMKKSEFIQELDKTGIKDPQRIKDHVCAAGFGENYKQNTN